jgi:hypothetical protein
MLPLLRLLTTNLNRLVGDISVYEWKYGKKPDILLPPKFVQIQKIEKEVFKIIFKKYNLFKNLFFVLGTCFLENPN